MLRAGAQTAQAGPLRAAMGGRAQPRLKRLVELGQLVIIGSGTTEPHKGYHLKQGV